MSTRQWVDDRNLEWSARLRRVSLVAELEVDDDDLERAERVLSLQLQENAAKLVAQHHPAFLLVALTSAGMRSWEEGTFYAKVAATLEIRKDQAEAATLSFRDCLRRFNLPTFEEAKGMRWVTPVLLHGAVPLDHLDELLDLLAFRRRRDPSLTGESFVEWARLPGNSLTGQPKALTRFLVYGGDFAPDYVGRVLDLIDGGDAALPRRAAQRLQELLLTGRGPAAGRRALRPTIAVTREESVVVRLPPVKPLRGRSVTWRVHFGDRVVERIAQVPWTDRGQTTEGISLDITTPLRDLTVEWDGATAVLPFVRSEDPLLLFDADGELVAPTRAVPVGLVTVMWPRILTTAAVPTDREGHELVGVERDPPYGWEGWSVLRTSVSPGDAVRLGTGPWRRVVGNDRARVAIGPVIPGLLTSDGREVTSELPVVELPVETDPGDWTVLVSDADGKLVERVVPVTTSVPLLAGRASPFVGDLTVVVRGPLGRGTSRRAAVAERVDLTPTPPHRRLVIDGGLEPATVDLRRGGGSLATVALGRKEHRADVMLEGHVFVVEPTHVAFSLVESGIPGPWVTEPLSLSQGSIEECVLRIKGLPLGASPLLVLRTGAEGQQVRSSGAGRTSHEFKLSAFSDLARRVGSGTLFLATEELASIGTLRPARLIDAPSYADGRLTVQALVGAKLEFVLHRHAAPWLGGTVLPVEPEGTSLPASLVGRGPLRVRVRTADEWTPDPTDTFPRRATDVFDIPMLWAPDGEDPEVVAVCRILVGAPGDPTEAVTGRTLARVLEVVAADANLGIETTKRWALTRLLGEHPQRALEGVLETRAATPQITMALVESGLVAGPVESLRCDELVESLLSRSSLAAVLAASAGLGTPNGSPVRIGDLLTTALGDDLPLLWSGACDDVKLGRFEPEFAAIPERVRSLYRLLDPVPGRMLDGDTRIAAVYEMWEARGHLNEASESALATINVARRVIMAEASRLWPMVQGRLSQDGVIALPVLSVALALVARLAAWRGGDARTFIAQRARLYTSLARQAPSLVAIDLVRADAAVIGVL